MSRPSTIVTCSSNRVRISIDTICRRRRSIIVRSLLHHRSPILYSFETHKLSVRLLLGAPSRRQQIYKEGEDVESKDERDDPFENGRYVLFTGEGGDCKDNGEDDLHDNEHEFEPEGKA